MSHSDYEQTKPVQNGKSDADFPDVGDLHGMKKHFCDWLSSFIWINKKYEK